MMKDKPILFSGPMVRAILEGRKTQTRRLVKGGPVRVTQFIGRDDKPTHEFGLHLTHDRVINKHVRCPFGQPGGRLWVRETWAKNDKGIFFKADFSEATINAAPPDWKWKPSIHLKRSDARLTLEVTGVRVERLQDISEDDAKAEGVEQLARSAGTNYRGAFQHLWDSINKAWESNPWVWVVEFRRIDQ